MRTNVVLDDDLVREAFALTGAHTKRELLGLALEELVRHHRKKNLLELLQGAANEREWSLLSQYLEVQDYLESGPDTWTCAARIYFDLRRQGETVRSAIDCCIAQLCLEYGALLVHRDRDFETIAQIRPLRQQRF